MSVKELKMYAGFLGKLRSSFLAWVKLGAQLSSRRFSVGLNPAHAALLPKGTMNSKPYTPGACIETQDLQDMVADAYAEWRGDWASATFGGDDAAKDTYKAPTSL